MSCPDCERYDLFIAKYREATDHVIANASRYAFQPHPTDIVFWEPMLEPVRALADLMAKRGLALSSLEFTAPKHTKLPALEVVTAGGIVRIAQKG